MLLSYTHFVLAKALRDDCECAGCKIAMTAGVHSHAHRTTPSYHRWLQLVEEAGVGRAWSLVPLCAQTRHHLHLTNTTFHELMMDAGMTTLTYPEIPEGF